MNEASMKFIELTGAALMKVLGPDEAKPEALRAAGLTDKCFVRVNQQGDIEVRRHDRWDVIGGLLAIRPPAEEGERTGLGVSGKCLRPNGRMSKECRSTNDE